MKRVGSMAIYWIVGELIQPFYLCNLIEVIERCMKYKLQNRNTFITIKHSWEHLAEELDNSVERTIVEQAKGHGFKS